MCSDYKDVYICISDHEDVYTCIYIIFV